MVLRLESRFSHMLGNCLISDKGAQVVSCLAFLSSWDHRPDLTTAWVDRTGQC